MLRVALLLTFLAVACAPESVDSAAVVTTSRDVVVAAGEAPAASEPVLRLADVNLPMGMLAAAVERWQAATGVRIDLDASGVPVEVVTDAFTPRGQVCAVTQSSADGPLSIRIDATPPTGFGCRADAADSLAHEIGHALCRFYAPVGGDCHARGGVMGHRAELGSAITADTLETVCDSVPCSEFNPE